MERTEFKRKLEEFINAEEISVELFFIFRNSDINIQYRTDPNPELRNVLIKDFFDELERYIEDDNPYELIDIYDDNEQGEYNLYYDHIDNNETAKSTFVFEHDNVQSYSNDVGELSKIHAFLIEFYNGNEYLSIYKRNMPTNAVNPNKLINFMAGVGNKEIKLVGDLISVNQYQKATKNYLYIKRGKLVHFRLEKTEILMSAIFLIQHYVSD